MVGYRTQLMTTVGMFYLGALIVMGMIRYAPFLFGLLVPVIGGRLLSLDRARNVTPRFGQPVAKRLVPALIVLAAINAVAAVVTAFSVGITPDGYTDAMQSVVTAFMAIFSGLFAFVGWLQQHPGLDHSSGAMPATAVERIPV